MTFEEGIIPKLSVTELLNYTTTPKVPEELEVDVDKQLYPVITMAINNHLAGITFTSEPEAEWMFDRWEEHAVKAIIAWVDNYAHTYSENTLEPRNKMYLRKPRSYFDTIGWMVRIDGELFLYAPVW